MSGVLGSRRSQGERGVSDRSVRPARHVLKRRLSTQASGVVFCMTRQVPSDGEQRVGLGVVGAAQPGRRAAVFHIDALPGLRARFAFGGNGPEAPDFLAGFGIVGSHEAPVAVLAAAHAGQDQVADRNGRPGVEVVLLVVGGLGIPDFRAGEAVQGHQMRVVRADVNLVSVRRHAAVGVVADSALRRRTGPAPQLTAGEDW